MMRGGFILERLIVPLGDFFMGTSFIRLIKRWRSYDAFSESELKELQRKSLKSTLHFAKNNLKKYQQIPLAGNNPEEWIAHFPVLTKEDLRNNPDELLTNVNLKNVHKVYSSGSTGESTFVYMNKEELSSIHALTIHLWELLGYRIGDRIVQTGISVKRTFLKKMKDIFFKTYYVSAFLLTEKDLEVICKQLQKRNVKTLIGYPSTINIIAEFAIKNNYSISLDTIIGLGDKLFNTYRETIEKAFNTQIKETYGSSEGFQIGFQADLNYMYIYSPQVYLEILDETNKPVKDGEIGSVVVTRLDNRLMPLIRYKIGDLAIKLPREKYPRERKYNFPLLEKVVGRETDMVILPNNTKLVVHSFTGIFEYIDGIKQFKIIQNCIHSITIVYVESTSFSSETIPLLSKKLHEMISIKNFEIVFKKVEEITNSTSGKVQIIESSLHNNE